MEEEAEEKIQVWADDRVPGEAVTALWLGKRFPGTVGQAVFNKAFLHPSRMGRVILEQMSP